MEFESHPNLVSAMVTTMAAMTPITAEYVDDVYDVLMRYITMVQQTLREDQMHPSHHVAARAAAEGLRAAVRWVPSPVPRSRP